MKQVFLSNKLLGAELWCAYGVKPRRLRAVCRAARSKGSAEILRAFIEGLCPSQRRVQVTPTLPARGKRERFEKKLALPTAASVNPLWN